jgi:L-fuculose-phosphate aldolase
METAMARRKRSPVQQIKPGAAEERAARAAVIATALDMSRRGLSPGRSGNVSQRWGEGMLITPTGMAYDALTPDDIVYVAANGKVAPGSRKPSSEWQFHLSAYAARSDMHAVVHAHSMHAVVLACAHRPIPAFHYMVAIAGADVIPCVPYATFGTAELAQHVAGGLSRTNACLMANHGQIAMGTSLAAALELAAEVETLAEQYYKVLAIGGPHLLDAAEMADVLERFKGYGQKAQG